MEHVVDGELRRNYIKHNFLANLHLARLIVEHTVNGALVAIAGIRDDKDGAEAFRGLASPTLVTVLPVAHLLMPGLCLNHRLVGKVCADVVSDADFLPFFEIATDTATKVKYTEVVAPTHGFFYQ